MREFLYHHPQRERESTALAAYAPGFFRETASDQVMEKVDVDGRVLGFSVLKVSSLRETPLEVAL